MCYQIQIERTCYKMQFTILCDDLNGGTKQINVTVSAQDLNMPINQNNQKWNLHNLTSNDLKTWYNKNEDYLDDYFEQTAWAQNMTYLEPIFN